MNIAALNKLNHLIEALTVSNVSFKMSQRQARTSDQRLSSEVLIGMTDLTLTELKSIRTVLMEAK